MSYERQHYQAVSLDKAILGRDNYDGLSPLNEVYALTDSIGWYLIQLQEERNSLRERVKLLERENDGLRLALIRKAKK